MRVIRIAIREIKTGIIRFAYILAERTIDAKLQAVKRFGAVLYMYSYAGEHHESKDDRDYLWYVFVNGHFEVVLSS